MSEAFEQLDHKDFRQIGYLIRCGLKRNHNITKDPEYADCFEAYLSSEAFRSAFERIASGMGLTAVTIPETGILFSVHDQESPFSPTLADMGKKWKREERILIAVCMIGVVAFFFKDGVQAASHKEASFQDLVNRVERLIDERREEAQDAGDVVKFWEKLEKAAKMGYTPKRKDFKQGSLRWAMEQGLEYFSKNGFISSRTTSDGEVIYIPKRRFRRYVEETTVEDLESALDI